MKQVYAKDMKRGRYYLIYGSTPKSKHPFYGKRKIHSKSASIIKFTNRDDISTISSMVWNRQEDAHKFKLRTDYYIEVYQHGVTPRTFCHMSATPTASDCTRKVIFELEQHEILMQTNEL